MFCSIHWLLFFFFLVVPVCGWEVNLIHLLTTLATRFVFRFACLDDLFELFGLVTPEKTSQPIGVLFSQAFHELRMQPLTHWRLKRKYYVLSGILSSKSLTIKSQQKLKNIANLLKSKYNTIEYDCVIRKVNKSFFKPSGFKYDEYCQEYIHFSSRRHTKEITSGYEKVLVLQKPISVLIKKREY